MQRKDHFATFFVLKLLCKNMSKFENNLQKNLAGILEDPGKPTIWEDKVSEHVKGADGYYSIRVLKDGNSQVHYYIEEENSQFIELEWEEPKETMESPFEITVTAKNKVEGVAIPNVLYIVEVDGGDFEAVELVDGEQKQKLGYDISISMLSGKSSF